VGLQIVAGEFLLGRRQTREGASLLAGAVEQSLTSGRPLGPEARQAVIRLGWRLAGRGQTDAARRLLTEAAAAAPDNPDIARMLQELTR
jgi:hypothetical protein